jgi:hypothetical protein
MRMAGNMHIIRSCAASSIPIRQLEALRFTSRSLYRLTHTAPPALTGVHLSGFTTDCPVKAGDFRFGGARWPRRRRSSRGWPRTTCRTPYPAGDHSGGYGWLRELARTATLPRISAGCRVVIRCVGRWDHALLSQAGNTYPWPHSIHTVTVCCAWGAAWYLALPAWLALMTQVPGLLKVTVEPEIEHTASGAGSVLKVTGLPDPPPVAVTV